MNDKIKDFSFKKLDNLAEDIVAKNQEITENTNTSENAGNESVVNSDFSDDDHYETDTIEGSDASDDSQPHDDVAVDDSSDGYYDDSTVDV